VRRGHVGVNKYFANFNSQSATSHTTASKPLGRTGVLVRNSLAASTLQLFQDKCTHHGTGFLNDSRKYTAIVNERCCCVWI